MKGKLVLSIITVFAAGMTAGLLVAPRKGKKTRRILKSAVMDCVERVNEFLGKGDIPEVEEKSETISPVA